MVVQEPGGVRCGGARDWRLVGWRLQPTSPASRLERFISTLPGTRPVIKNYYKNIANTVIIIRHSTGIQSLDTGDLNI